MIKVSFFIRLFVMLLCVMVICGCDDSDIDTDISDCFPLKQPSSNTEIGENTTEVVDNTDLAVWLGEYFYEETWENRGNSVVPAVDYNLNVYTNDGEFYAHLTVVGFQTEIDVHARVRGDCSRIVLYDAQATEDSFPIIEQGSILLELYNENGIIKTEWEAITPSIENDKNDYFKRITL